MDEAVILYNGAELFQQLINIFATGGTMWKLVKTDLAV